MTGYGGDTQTYMDKTITVEVRSLNSKMTDLRIKLPTIYKDKEFELRKYLKERVHRGKIEMTISSTSSLGDDVYKLNSVLFKTYYTEIQNLTRELGGDAGNIVAGILRLPNVVALDDTEISDEEWDIVLETVRNATNNLNQFRLDEGKTIEDDLIGRINAILQYLKDLVPFEKKRIPVIRERMQRNLKEFMARENVDKNRFEQEVLHYIEKIDINEEKVRLEQHCKYFLDELTSNEIQKGRKLNFISQEMGREINTLGSKAYSSDIQKFVVKMKDELEKIKEQIANSV